MIITEMVRIRPVERDDVEWLYKNSARELNGDYQGFHFESKQNIIKEYEDGKMFDEKFNLMMVEDLQRNVIGDLYVNFIRDGLIRLGLRILPDARSNGVGTHVVREITKYLFENYPVVRIEADTDVDNIGARKSLESAGMELEGIARKFRFHHGKYHDSCQYSMVRE